jgi:hypothetical protein
MGGKEGEAIVLVRAASSLGPPMVLEERYLLSLFSTVACFYFALGMSMSPNLSTIPNTRSSMQLALGSFVELLCSECQD